MPKFLGGDQSNQRRSKQLLLTDFHPEALIKRQAEVAELADALGSGPSGLTMPVEVQVLSSVLSSKDLRREA